MSKIIGSGGLMLGLLVAPMGAFSLVEQIGNRTPQAITFAQFAAQKPEKGNFRLSGATLCLTETVWIENTLSGEMGNIYVPARASATAQGDDGKPVLVLVRVDDPQIAATVAEARKLESAKTPQEQMNALNWTLKNQKKLYVSRPVQGVLAEGFESLDDKEKNLIESSGLKLEDDFVILQENTKPQFGLSIGAIVVGLGLIAWGVLRLKGRAEGI